MGDVWRILLYVGLAGGCGGLLNAFLSNNTNPLPWQEVGRRRVFWPGLIVNFILGIIAAALSWALYGPSREFVLVGLRPGDPIPVYLTVEALASALVIGMGGARWLTNEVEKRVQRTTIMTLAAQTSRREAGPSLAISTPLETLRSALRLGESPS